MQNTLNHTEYAKFLGVPPIDEVKAQHASAAKISAQS